MLSPPGMVGRNELKELFIFFPWWRVEDAKLCSSCCKSVWLALVAVADAPSVFPWSWNGNRDLLSVSVTKLNMRSLPRGRNKQNGPVSSGGDATMGFEIPPILSSSVSPMVISFPWPTSEVSFAPWGTMGDASNRRDCSKSLTNASRLATDIIHPGMCFSSGLVAYHFVSHLWDRPGFTMSESSDTGFVGFANLPNQVHRKSVKRGFEFTLMVVGKWPKGAPFSRLLVWQRNAYRDAYVGAPFASRMCCPKPLVIIEKWDLRLVCASGFTFQSRLTRIVLNPVYTRRERPGYVVIRFFERLAGAYLCHVLSMDLRCPYVALRQWWTHVVNA